MARKWLLFCFSALLCLSLLPAAALAAPSSALSVVVSNASLQVGERVQVTVKAAELADLYAYELSLYYNASLLEFEAGSETTELKGFAVPAKVVETGGNHVVYAHTKTGATASDSGSLNLVTLTFVAKQAGIAAIELKNAKLIDSQLNQTQGSTAAATITIGGSSGGTDNNGGNGSNSGNVEPKDSIEVTGDHLAKAADGKIIVPMTGSATRLYLPYNAGELLGSNDLEVQTSGMKLIVPAAVLKQLPGTVSSDLWKESRVVLVAEPVTDTNANLFVNKAESLLGANITVGGTVYEFSLYLLTADGAMHSLTQFAEPMTIRITMDASLNAKLSGIYYVTDNLVEYVGGKVVDGEMIAEITHFSQYALLEVNKKFNDLSDSHWAAGAIKELAAKQIISGTSADLFQPERSVTRAEFTALLVRTLKLSGEGHSAFTDVPETAWYANDVELAVHAGIVKGKSASLFAPNEQITREELVVLMIRALEWNNKTVVEVTDSGFSDKSQIAAWASDDVSKAAALGLIQGRAEGKFVPKGISTRAEAAQVIYNLRLQLK